MAGTQRLDFVSNVLDSSDFRVLNFEGCALFFLYRFQVFARTREPLTLKLHLQLDPSCGRYAAHVELSSKVLDSRDRLRQTLAHELCHVAAWLLDHVSKPHHGEVR